MKRSWNPLLWAGFATALLAFLSYFLFFYRFPATRDVPWVNLLLFLVSAVLLVAGLKRAFRDPERYRGKISGIVLGVLSVAVFGLFWFSTYYFTRLLPSSADAPRVGQRAPDFALADATGKTVALSEMLKSNRAVLLIFYRGYW